jgi:membrane-bound ClpP family serine protease
MTWEAKCFCSFLLYIVGAFFISIGLNDIPVQSKKGLTILLGIILLVFGCFFLGKLI